MPSTPSVLVAHSGLRFALFPIPVITLFWKDEIGMSFTAIMGLQAIFSATIVVLQFPTGYVADRIGYRASLLIGAVFWAAGCLAYVVAESFAAIVAAEILLGVGTSFTSGADSALLYSSVERGSYVSWEGRVRAAAQTTEAATSAIGGWLYTLAPRLPFWLQAAAALATIGTAWATREPVDRIATSRVSHLRRALEIVQTSLWRDPRLRATIALSLVMGLSSYFLVWLIQPYMQAHGVPTAWFGAIWAALHVYLAGVSMLSHRVAVTFGMPATLLGCCALIAIGYGGLALGASALSFLFYLCLLTVRGLQGPLLAQALQAGAPPDDRATVLSLNAMIFRIAFTILGPVVGLLVERAGMAASLGITGAVLTLVAFATFLAFHRAHGGTLARGRTRR